MALAAKVPAIKAPYSRMIPRGLIDPSNAQPRLRTNADKDQRLRKNMDEKGQLQNVAVTEEPNGRFMLIAGESRWRATASKGPHFELEAKVWPPMDPVTRFKMAIAENLIRTPLSIAEEAHGIKWLLDHGSSLEDAANEFGKSKNWAEERLLIAKLPESEHWRFHDDTDPKYRPPIKVATRIARVKDPKLQRQLLAETAVMPQSTGMSRVNRVVHERGAATTTMFRKPVELSIGSVVSSQFDTIESIIDRMLQDRRYDKLKPGERSSFREKVDRLTTKLSTLRKRF